LNEDTGGVQPKIGTLSLTDHGRVLGQDFDPPTAYAICKTNHPYARPPKDPGQTTSWVPAEAWDFIKQF